MEKIPAVATSKEWQNYNESKENKNIRLLEEKKKKAEDRKKKKEEADIKKKRNLESQKQKKDILRKDKLEQSHDQNNIRKEKYHQRKINNHQVMMMNHGYNLVAVSMIDLTTMAVI